MVTRPKYKKDPCSRLDPYQTYYHFRDLPFSPSPDPEFLFLSDSYETALAVLANGLGNQEAVNIVLGETGTGKTILMEFLLKKIPPDCAVSLITNTVSSARELYELTLAGFGQAVKKSGPEHLYQQLHEYLEIAFLEYNQSPLLLIDDADTISIDALKALNNLIDMSSETKRFMQIVLLGRQGLLDLLEQPELERFAKKIGTLCYLEPLTCDETQSYIHHRLLMAGAENENLFDAQACLTVYELSKGIPSKINKLCSDALVCGFAEQKHHVGTDLIHRVANENWQPRTAEFKAPRYRGISKTTFLLGGVLAGAAGAAFLAPDNFFLQSHQLQPQDSVESFNEAQPGDHVSKHELRLDTGLEHRMVATDRQRNDASNKTLRLEKIEKQPRLIGMPGSPSRSPTLSIAAAQRIDRDRRVAELLARAEKQMAAKQLNTPAGNAAYESYQQILELVPGHEGALRGIEQIKEQYRQWAETNKRRGNWKIAHSHLEKALALDPEDATLLAALDELKEARSSAQERRAIREAQHRRNIEWDSVQEAKVLQQSVRPKGHEAMSMVAPQTQPEVLAPSNKRKATATQKTPDTGTKQPGASQETIGKVAPPPSKATFERPPMPIVINEFMADNEQTIANRYGGYGDWIEIYNPNPEAVDLSGHYLSNDADDRKKWHFPEGTTIKGRSHLLIWADKRSRNGISSELHTNFDLLSTGGRIVLTNEKGSEVDSVTFGRQREDLSIGRDARGVFTTKTRPTPGR